MLSTEQLRRVSWDCIHFSDEAAAQDARGRLASSQLAVLQIDGTGIREAEDLFAAVSKTFAFPDYFGMNWDALDECLRNLDWLPAEGYVLFVSGASRLWGNSNRVAAGLLKAWLSAAESWSRQTIPFHLVFVW